MCLCVFVCLCAHKTHTNTHKHIYSGARPGDLAFFRPTHTEIGLRLCRVFVFVCLCAHTNTHKHTQTHLLGGSSWGLGVFPTDPHRNRAPFVFVCVVCCVFVCTNTPQTHKHIYSGARPGDLAFFRPTHTEIGVRLCVCVFVCLCTNTNTQTHKHKNTNDPSWPVDLEVFDPARGLVSSRHPSFWASGRPTRGLVGFVFVWSEIFQEGRFDNAFRCALESHAIMTPPVCSIRDRMRWARSCGRVRCGRSPRQSPVPPGQLRSAVSVF